MARAKIRFGRYAVVIVPMTRRFGISAHTAQVRLSFQCLLLGNTVITTKHGVQIWGNTLLLGAIVGSDYYAPPDRSNRSNKS